jgi:hypothetical protein
MTKTRDTADVLETLETIQDDIINPFLLIGI